MAPEVPVLRSLMASALAVTLCLPVASVSAQAGPAGRPAAAGIRRPQGVSPRPAPASAAIRPQPTTIQGSAWRADHSPIPHALLRLRNMTTGKIQAQTVADAAGRFVFSGIPQGTYLVELVSEGGRILTVGHVFAVAPGETVATFVRLGPTVPWFTGFFGTAALAVAAGAATAGVVALSPEIVTSVSPNR